MKKFPICLVACASVLALASCNIEFTYEETVNHFDNINQKLLAELPDNQILLDLTPNGLYNGEKGESSDEYFLENFILFDISESQELPLEGITCTTQGNEFAYWVYAEDGRLLSTSTALDGVKYYQAFWKNESQGGETTSEPDPTSVEVEEGKLYFVENNVWGSDGVWTWAHLWNDSSSTAWPGTAMELVGGQVGSRMFSIDLGTYNHVIFTRQPSATEHANNDGKCYNQTGDVAIPEGYNCAAIEGSWDNWSIVWSKI